MQFLKVLFLISTLLSTYVFAAFSTPGSLLIEPISGERLVSGDNITITFLPGSDLPSSFDVIRLARAEINDYHILDTNVQLPPGQDQYSFTYVVPDGLPSDPRWVIGGGTAWNAGETITIAWRGDGSLQLYETSNITQFQIFNNVNNTWTPILIQSVPVTDRKYQITLPNNLAPQNGYQLRIVVERDNAL
ncbi:11785_t:CDS:2, partial [Racocetra fulgida]